MEEAEPQARVQTAGSVTPTGSLEIVKLEGAQNSTSTRAELIRRRAELRATVLIHVEDALAQLRELQQIELDNTERLIAEYAIADLERISHLVDLDSDEVESVLESRSELHEVRGRLERARDFFLRMREPVAQRLVAEAILRVATTLAGM